MNNTEVTIGEMVVVPNKNHEFGEADFYNVAWIDRAGIPHAIMFTDAEYEAMHERAERNKGDMPDLVKVKSIDY